MKDKKYYIFSLDLKLLNIFSFVIMFLIFILTFVIDREFLISSIEYVFSPGRLFVTFVLIIIYLMLHELLHSIGYYIYGAKYKNIVYGIELEKGIFYCLCKENIKRRNILNSLMYPLFYIGVATYIIGLSFSNEYLLILSMFNISGCVGDIFTFLYISGLPSDIEFSEYDDTTSFAIYSEKDLSSDKAIGLKYMGIRDNITRKEFTKIKVSTASYVTLIIMFCLSFVTLWL